MIMDWKKAATETIEVFDAALGRPPFPAAASPDLVAKADAVYTVLRQVTDAGKLKMLEGATTVTTTLPILCASLREGSPDHRACLVLYRPILLSSGLVASLSTYPVSYLVRDAKELLGASLYETCDPNARSNAINEVTLFHFLSTTQSLTAEDTRQFLRVTLPPAEEANGAKKGRGRGKQMMPLPSSKGATNSSSSASLGVSRELLEAMVDAPLTESCRGVLETYLNGTEKFLDVVGSDGTLASRILDVYGARLIPQLEPSSLLPCLDAPLLDYYVDIVVCAQKEGRCSLLSSPELRALALRSWDGARLARLAKAALQRRNVPQEAGGCLHVYAFLYLVYGDMYPVSGSEINGASPPTATHWPPSAEEVDASAIELALVLSINAAMSTVLSTEKKTKADRLQHTSNIESKTGMVVVNSANVPAWIETLKACTAVLAARPLSAAAAVGLKGSPALTDLSRDVPELKTTITGPSHLLQGRLRELLVAVVTSPPKAAASLAQPPIAVKTQPSKKNAPKSRGKQKNNAPAALTVIAPGKPETLPAIRLIPLSEVLSACCSALLWSTLLSGLQPPQVEGEHAGVQSSAVPLLSIIGDVVRAYDYLLRHQPQRMNRELWKNFLNLLTLVLWRQSAPLSRVQAPESGSGGAFAANSLPVVPLELFSTVLTAATADTDVALWLSPLVLPDFGVATPVPSMWSSPQRALWMAVLQASLNASPFNSKLPCALQQCLFPVAPSFVFGTLCSVLDESALQDLAEATVSASADGSGGAILAGLTRLRSIEWAKPSAPKTMKFSSFLPTTLSSDVPRRGLQRLLDLVGAVAADHRAVISAAEEEANAAAQHRIQDAIEEKEKLTRDHARFRANADVQQVVKAQVHQQVQEERVRRAAEAEARCRDEAAAKARKVTAAVATMREKAAQTRAEREERRQAGFAAYQRRLVSIDRVSTFLEHLQLPSARVVATREALLAVLDTISPDDLLEYLVTGEAKVPQDMLEEEESVEVVSSGVPGLRQVPQLANEVRQTGERRDFWAEVMDHPVTDAPLPLALKGGNAGNTISTTHSNVLLTSSAPIVTHNAQSFHRRVAPLLDLFFYEDGDEYGNVPNALPSLRLRVASRIWTPERVQTRGYADLRAAFTRMEQRGLVRIHDDVVQLTLLGFRYHFPYHDPDQMLEVHLREARDRVHALLAQRGEGSTKGEEEEDEEYDGEEYWSHSSNEEEETEERPGQNQLLPEVEFGI